MIWEQFPIGIAPDLIFLTKLANNFDPKALFLIWRGYAEPLPKPFPAPGKVGKHKKHKKHCLYKESRFPEAEKAGKALTL